MQEYQFDLIIIGAGPGGYEAAFSAQSIGMKVAIIEKASLGGTCLNRGCIPTKTLMHSSDVYRLAKNGAEIGVDAQQLTVDRGRIGARKDEVIEQLQSGIATLIAKKKIELYYGAATITGEHSIALTPSDGGQTTELTADKLLIATGSYPFIPPIPGAQLDGVIDSTELIDMGGARIPRFVIIGGGVIGIEFATIYADLGDKVTIIEAAERLLPTIDKEIGRSIKLTLENKSVDVYVKSPVDRIERSADGLRVYFTTKDGEKMAEADKVLLCVGRRPVTEGLFTDSFGASYDFLDEKRFISVNDQYQTACPNIYAIGDCIGGIQLAHVATAEGRRCISIMSGKPVDIDMNTVPSCIYTDPEIAVVGMTADEAKQSGIEVITRKQPMSANGKTLIDGQGRGFIKLVARADNHVLIGAQLMCGRASDLVGELALAISAGLTIEDVAKTIHPHPSFVEAIMDASWQ